MVLVRYDVHLEGVELDLVDDTLGGAVFLREAHPPIAMFSVHRYDSAAVGSRALA